MDSDRGGSLTLSALELGMMHLAHESSAWLERRLKVAALWKALGNRSECLTEFRGRFFEATGPRRA
jgi:hypothetical protein